MAEAQGMTDELRAMIGVMTEEPVILEVERGAIRRYADAIDDPNRVYRDVEYARSKGHRELICPPGFFGWPVKAGDAMSGMSSLVALFGRAGFPRLLDGGMEYEFFVPVRAGDTLTSYGKVADIAEREGKSGKMLIMTRETTYVNQNGDTVAKVRSNLIFR